MEKITIVSGLPRSGTTLMMRILESCGMPIIQDHIRKPDIDNPNGYYEFEKVKRIKSDASWLFDARGKVFKMVSMLLCDLPPEHEYRIIFMRRDMREILASQAKMLQRLGLNESPVSDEEMGLTFTHHLLELDQWIARQKNMEIFHVNYNGLLKDPHPQLSALAHFIDHPLDVDKMKSIIDDDLYRNRAEVPHKISFV